MRTKLLLSTAAVALMLAAPAAFAQSNSDKKPEAAKEQTQAKPAQQEKAAEHKAQDNKAAASDKSQLNKGAAQTQQPKQQQSATERPQHERQNSENKAAQQNAKERNAKEQNAQKQSPERSAKDANTPQNKAAGTNKRSTTGQSAPSEQKPASQPQQTQSPAAQQNKTNAAPQNTTSGNAPNVGGSNTNATNNAPNAAGTNTTQRNTATVNAQQLPPDQRVKISETISRTRDLAPPVRDLRVSINIGTRVPEHVHLRRLPSEIVTIVPAYREYDYFTTEEDVVIVNPRTREVVTMVPRDASRARAEVGSSSTQVSSMSGGMSGAMSGPPPCQVLRREASGQTVPVDPQDLSRSTTGSGSSDRNQLAVTVQAPNGQSMPPIALPEQTGQIVVATDNGDCKITIEPGAR